MQRGLGGAHYNGKTHKSKIDAECSLNGLHSASTHSSLTILCIGFDFATEMHSDKHITTINTPQTHHCCGYICKICVMSSFGSRIPNLNSTIDIAESNSDQIQISLTIKTAYQIQNLRLQRINKQSAAGNIIPPIPATTYSVASIEFILHNILGSGNHCNSTTFAPSKKLPSHVQVHAKWIDKHRT